MSCVFLLDVCCFTSVTFLSRSRWLLPLLVLLGIHSLESEMCLHFEHVTNYLLRLTLRDLAEAFTLLRCCLGQTYFRGLLSQFDCLYLTGVLQARCEPREKVKLAELRVGVCFCACMHSFIWMFVWAYIVWAACQHAIKLCWCSICNTFRGN